MSETRGKVIEEAEIRKMARQARGFVHQIFLHWTGGHYGVNEDAYHLCVDRDGKHDINDTMLFAYILLKHKKIRLSEHPSVSESLLYNYIAVML